MGSADIFNVSYADLMPGSWFKQALKTVIPSRTTIRGYLNQGDPDADN